MRSHRFRLAHLLAFTLVVAFGFNLWRLSGGKLLAFAEGLFHAGLVVFAFIRCTPGNLPIGSNASPHLQDQSQSARIGPVTAFDSTRCAFAAITMCLSIYIAWHHYIDELRFTDYENSWVLFWTDSHLGGGYEFFFSLDQLADLVYSALVLLILFCPSSSVPLQQSNDRTLFRWLIICVSVAVMATIIASLAINKTFMDQFSFFYVESLASARRIEPEDFLLTPVRNLHHGAAWLAFTASAATIILCASMYLHSRYIGQKSVRQGFSLRALVGRLDLWTCLIGFGFAFCALFYAFPERFPILNSLWIQHPISVQLTGLFTFVVSAIVLTQRFTAPHPQLLKERLSNRSSFWVAASILALTLWSFLDGYSFEYLLSDPKGLLDHILSSIFESRMLMDIVIIIASSIALYRSLFRKGTLCWRFGLEGNVVSCVLIGVTLLGLSWAFAPFGYALLHLLLHGNVSMIIRLFAQ